MMTKEKRLVFGLDDIRAVTFQCKECRGRVTMLPDDARLKVPGDCPVCHMEWYSAPLVKETAASVGTPFNDFVGGIRRLRELQGAGQFKFSLLLEFDDPS